MSSSFLARALRSLPLRSRLKLFGALERLSEWRNPPANRPKALDAHAALRRATGERAAVWLFVSTIGEVHAIEPFTRQLLAALDDPPLVLLSDRDTYAAAYRAKYPQARVLETRGRAAPILQALERDPPALLLVAEIPCVLHDAPCRLPFAAVQAARDAGARVVLVNGWLYGYRPGSGLDRLERLLFDDDYVRAFDLALVQTDAVREVLLARGAAPERVVVSGNIKFDARVDITKARETSLARALAARAGPADGAAPIIVAGSVTETADHAALLQAFAVVLRAHPHALLVLAPRHPENAPRMDALLELLVASSLAWRRRSEHDAPTAVQAQVLVLDTMGELQGCYASARLAFVGRDHNVLEPLAFDKPVFVGPGWEATYPSYPVYRQLMDAGGLHAVEDLAELGAVWCRVLAATATEPCHEVARGAAVLRRSGGAAARGLAALRARGLLPPGAEPVRR